MYVFRANMMTRDDREQLNNMADPHHTLDEFMRNIHGMEQAYRRLLSRGDITTPTRWRRACSSTMWRTPTTTKRKPPTILRRRPSRCGEAINAAADAVPKAPGTMPKLANGPKVQWCRLLAAISVAVSYGSRWLRQQPY